MLFTPPDGGAPVHGSATKVAAQPGQLALTPAFSFKVDGTYGVRTRAFVRDEVARLAIPLTGTLTVARD